MRSCDAVHPLTLVGLTIDLDVHLDVNANVVGLVVVDQEHVHSIGADGSLHIDGRLHRYTKINKYIYYIRDL